MAIRSQRKRRVERLPAVLIDAGDERVRLMQAVLDIAIVAGELVSDYVQSEHALERKDDASPATAVDRAAEAGILADLARVATGIPVVAAEEVAAGRLPVLNARFFLVDALDGAQDFISGGTDFTVNIGLIERGVPTLGVVYAPARSTVYWGDTVAGEAWRATQSPHGKRGPPVRIAVRQPTTSLRAVASKLHNTAETEAWLRAATIDNPLLIGSSLKFVLVAAGEADVYPRPAPTMEWDTAAGDAVLRAAGGRVLDPDGDPLLYGKPNFLNPGFLATGPFEPPAIRPFMRSNHPEPASATNRISRTENDVQLPDVATRRRSFELDFIFKGGLFDTQFYLAQYPEIAQNDVSALEHFYDIGYRQGRRPNLYFDPQWYLAQNPDVQQSGAHALVHYIAHGDIEGRKPSLIFDPSWYRKHNRLGNAENALAHYLTNRKKGHFAPIPEFDIKHYARLCPEVGTAGIDPFEHFISHGYREGRTPSPNFDPQFYSTRYLGGDTSQNPFLHYLAHKHDQGVFGHPPDDAPPIARDETPTPRDETPIPRAISFRGNFDTVDHRYISGWAQIPSISPKAACLELYVDDIFVTDARADLFRPDLLRAGIGDGRHGFEIPTPLLLLDGQPHKLSIHLANTALSLPNIPERVVVHSPLPLRHFTQVRDIVLNAKAQLEALGKLLSPDRGLDLLRRSDDATLYQRWFDKYGRLDPASRAALLAKAMAFPTKPTFSIIMPTFNTPVPMLQAAIKSVRNQLYPHWELCIADDASTASGTIDALKEIGSSDPRIKVEFRSDNGHISASTNSALSLATGDYICFLDHDDVLSDDALYQLARAVNDDDYDIIYSDEDKIDEFDIHHDPHFKPDFNYTLLLSYNYICHLMCIKESLVRKVGSFDTAMNGSQDYDFLLRCLENTAPNKIKHVPLVLYHWRAHAKSTALSMDSKGYAVVAGQGAIQAHLKRTTDTPTSVDLVPAGYRVTWSLPSSPPLVSIIIPTRDCPGILATCLSGLLNKTAYRNLEIIIVDNGSVEAETFKVFTVASSDPRVKILRHDKPFNYSEVCNLGAKHATGEFLLMLNNDIEIIDEHWLEEMVSQIHRPQVGAVGAKLLYPDGRIQHAGVILGVGGVAGHAHKYLDRASPGYISRAILAQELSACTAACLLVRRDVYEAVGGLNEVDLTVAFNDVDLCLRIRAAGYSIVYTPFATLYHHESLSRGLEDVPSKVLRSHTESAYMRARWSTQLDNDPFYSPNLTLAHEDFRIDVDRGRSRID